MIENSVVLPAPFGPTSATIWPSSTVSAAWSSASSPPKRREMFSTRSISVMAPQQSRDAARRERHDEDQHAAVDDEVEPRRVARYQFGDLAERLDHQCAEQRAVHRADAADDRREQRLDRDPRAVGDAGVEEQEVLGVEAAARRRDRGRERHRGELDAEHIDAEG